MYFPYLRGRRNELLAVRELVEKGLIGGNIYPIIEPVHFDKGLVTALEICIAKKQKIGLILNPQVGSFASELQKEISETGSLAVKFDTLIHGSANGITPGLILRDSCFNSFYKMFNRSTKIITVCDGEKSLPILKAMKADQKKCVCYNLVRDNSQFKAATSGLPNIAFEDHFNKRNKNADYADCEDESYISDLSCYRKSDYVGFADYSIVGSRYDEFGFAPRAIAIHIVYPDGKGLKIHHFVSYPSNDCKDQARKFGEAVGKLVQWNRETGHLKTEGIKSFEQLYKDQSFPGLGVIKKLSIMHHLQMMDEILRNSSAAI